MADLTIINARILTLAGPAAPRRGEGLRELGVVERGYVAISDGRMTAVAGGEPSGQPSDTTIDAARRVRLTTRGGSSSP